MVNSYCYRAFGLEVRSSTPLPGFAAASQGPKVPIMTSGAPLILHVEKYPDLKTWNRLVDSAHLDDSGKPLVRVERSAAGDCRFSYFDGCVFHVDSCGENAWLEWPPSHDLHSALIYFLGPVMTWILRLRGLLVVHASAIVYQDRALLFAGPQGAGKSTLAAAFATAGHAVLSDDTSALFDEPEAIFVLPATPQIRLWPDADVALDFDVSKLPALCRDWSKRQLELQSTADQGGLFDHQPRQIEAVYLLDDRSGHDLCVERLSGAEALTELLAHGACAPEMLDRPMRQREFDLLVRLTKEASVARVRRPNGCRAVDVVQAVLEDRRTAAAKQSPGLRQKSCTA